MLQSVLLDALFAAVAAIGFSAISRLPMRAYLFCALIAAAGHSLRFVLMSQGIGGMHIFSATLLASLFIGCLAVFLSPVAKIPSEAYLFPSLLPMIPGMYAYKMFGALAMATFDGTEQQFPHYFSLFAYNGLICMAVLVAMIVGATVPIFIFKRISFTATRNA